MDIQGRNRAYTVLLFESLCLGPLITGTFLIDLILGQIGEMAS